MDELLKAAWEVRAHAFAPYSGFLVGAAVQTDSGQVFAGCNVESATYGLTVCAERVAIFKAVSEGFRRYSRMCVVADTEALTSPCGACRQVIWELCGDIPILLANSRGDVRTVRSLELLPDPFDRRQLGF